MRDNWPLYNSTYIFIWDCPVEKCSNVCLQMYNTQNVVVICIYLSHVSLTTFSRLCLVGHSAADVHTQLHGGVPTFSTHIHRALSSSSLDHKQNMAIFTHS